MTRRRALDGESCPSCARPALRWRTAPTWGSATVRPPSDCGARPIGAARTEPTSGMLTEAWGTT